MTSCNHHPVFQLKMLFSRNPRYICKTCGAEIEMTPRTKWIGKIINALVIGLLVYEALSGNSTKSGSNSTLVYFGIMGGIILAFLLLQILLMNFGKFQEIESDKNSPDTSDKSDTEPVAPKPQYTQEQLDLMALYESYAKQSRPEGEEDPDTEVSAETAALPEVDNCDHKPAKNWKNNVPGVYDFTCEHCGKRITFSTARKRKLNLILLAFSSIVLMASFSSQNIPFWGLIVMALVILAVCSVVQYFFVKNSIFEIKDTDAK